MTTFDTESELTKIAGAYPGIQLVLRIRCDDPEVCWHAYYSWQF
jgi:hypothetical protein